MPGQSISGLALAEIAAGLILAWSGIENVSIQSVVKSFVSGKLPAAGPAVTYATPAQASESSSDGAGGTGNSAPVVAPVNASETAWIVALLASIGAPPTKVNINSIAGWIQHESSWNASPPDGAQYTNNPLNTTEPGFGGTSINSVGVKRYPTVAQGIGATVAAMENGDYSDILAALRSGKGLTGSYAGLSTWSGGGYSSI